ncbi:MAG TPA: helix-turn-helix transcriptional regulator [Pyrinomonadaceae bacterium]|jgi:transcriptional regulator with XRE-family HTH domain
MGRKPRRRPERLAEKLKVIREAFGLSQNEMVSRLGLNDELTREEVSAFERGTHEPNLLVLLAYSDAANVSLEVLARDSLDLPTRLPSPSRHQGIRQPSKDKPQKR